MLGSVCYCTGRKILYNVVDMLEHGLAPSVFDCSCQTNLIPQVAACFNISFMVLLTHKLSNWTLNHRLHTMFLILSDSVESQLINGVSISYLVRSPPRMQGIQSKMEAADFAAGITPACAGHIHPKNAMFVAPFLLCQQVF